MKRLLLTAFLVLFLDYVTASEYRDLSDAEEASLKAAASEEAGIGVWLIQANVIREQAGDTSLAKVIFEPADVAGYCLAPFVLFKGESSDAELLEWNLVKGGPVQYHFWYQTCDVADPQTPIVLEQYVDISVLERLKEEQGEIVGRATRRFSSDRDYNIPISEHRLRRVGIHFEPDHGAVYKLNYYGTVCRGLSIDAVLQPDEILIVRTTEWVC